MVHRKAEASCTGATCIRRAGGKVVFLPVGLAYDPKPLGAEARQLKGGWQRAHFICLYR